MPKRPHRAASSSHQSKAGDTGPADCRNRSAGGIAWRVGRRPACGSRLS